MGFSQDIRNSRDTAGFISFVPSSNASLLSHTLMNLILAPLIDVAPDVQQGAPLELIWFRFLGILIFHKVSTLRKLCTLCQDYFDGLNTV